VSLGCAFFLALFSSCNRIEHKVSPQKLEPTAASIQRSIMNGRCVRCHLDSRKENGYIPLTDFTVLVEDGKPHDHSSHKRFLIKPGCPKQSVFMSILRKGKMPPPPDAALSEGEFDVIEKWITSLKPEAEKLCESDEPVDSVPPGGGEPGGDEPGD